MSHKLRTSPHSTLSVSSTNLISKQKQIGFQFFEAIPFFIFYRNIFKQKFYILSSIPWNHNNINSFLKLFQIVLSHKHCLLKKRFNPQIFTKMRNVNKIWFPLNVNDSTVNGPMSWVHWPVQVPGGRRFPPPWTSRLPPPQSPSLHPLSHWTAYHCPASK